jgi:glycosyltransferase involved in cell wall biosynthesis
MSDRAPRLCLISPSPPSVSPRLVRSADALAGAGFDVVVVTTRFAKRLLPHDEPPAEQAWRHVFVDMGDSILGKFRWQLGRTRRKITLSVMKQFSLPLLVRRACTYVGPELASLASRQQAALYIAHTHLVLPSAADAARRSGAKLAFDAEDLLAECSHEVVQMMREIEERFIPECSFVSTMSQAAAERLRETLQLPFLPLVLHNTPSLKERRGLSPPDERPVSDKLSIYWFGQTIGRHSCAEQVLRALPLLSKPARLVLRGSPDVAYITELKALAASLGLEGSLEILPRAASTDMVRLAAEHDVLLGSQPSAEPFHQMAVGNKVFTGLMAGLVLALTETIAHRKLFKEMPGCGFLFPNRDHVALAERLNELTSAPEKFAAAKSASWRLGEKRFNWEIESKHVVRRVSELVQTDLHRYVI